MPDILKPYEFNPGRVQEIIGHFAQIPNQALQNELLGVIEQAIIAPEEKRISLVNAWQQFQSIAYRNQFALPMYSLVRLGVTLLFCYLDFRNQTEEYTSKLIHPRINEVVDQGQPDKDSTANNLPIRRAEWKTIADLAYYWLTDEDVNDTFELHEIKQRLKIIRSILGIKPSSTPTDKANFESGSGKNDFDALLMSTMANTLYYHDLHTLLLEHLIREGEKIPGEVLIILHNYLTLKFANQGHREIHNFMRHLLTIVEQQQSQIPDALELLDIVFFMDNYSAKTLFADTPFFRGVNFDLAHDIVTRNSWKAGMKQAIKDGIVLDLVARMWEFIVSIQNTKTARIFQNEATKDDLLAIMTTLAEVQLSLDTKEVKGKLAQCVRDFISMYQKCLRSPELHKFFPPTTKLKIDQFIESWYSSVQAELLSESDQVSDLSEEEIGLEVFTEYQQIQYFISPTLNTLLQASDIPPSMLQQEHLDDIARLENTIHEGLDNLFPTIDLSTAPGRERLGGLLENPAKVYARTKPRLLPVRITGIGTGTYIFRNGELVAASLEDELDKAKNSIGTLGKDKRCLPVLLLNNKKLKFFNPRRPDISHITEPSKTIQGDQRGRLKRVSEFYEVPPENKLVLPILGSLIQNSVGSIEIGAQLELVATVVHLPIEVRETKANLKELILQPVITILPTIPMRILGNRYGGSWDSHHSFSRHPRHTWLETANRIFFSSNQIVEDYSTGPHKRFDIFPQQRLVLAHAWHKVFINNPSARIITDPEEIASQKERWIAEFALEYYLHRHQTDLRRSNTQS